MPDLRLHRFFCQFRKAVPAVHRRTGFPCKRQHALCTAQPGFQRGAIWQEEEQNRVPIIPGEAAGPPQRAGRRNRVYARARVLQRPFSRRGETPALRAWAEAPSDIHQAEYP